VSDQQAAAKHTSCAALSALAAVAVVSCIALSWAATEITDINAQRVNFVSEARKLQLGTNELQQSADAQWDKLRAQNIDLLRLNEQQNETAGLLQDESDSLDVWRAAVEEADTAVTAEQQVIDAQQLDVEQQQQQQWANENETIGVLSEAQDAIDQLYEIDMEQAIALKEHKSVVDELEEEQLYWEDELGESFADTEEEQRQEGNEQEQQRAHTLAAQRGAMVQQETDETERVKVICEGQRELSRWKEAHPELWELAEGDKLKGADAVHDELDCN